MTSNKLNILKSEEFDLSRNDLIFSILICFLNFQDVKSKKSVGIHWGTFATVSLVDLFLVLF